MAVEPPSDAIIALIRTLDDPDRDVRKQALDALWTHPDNRCSIDDSDYPWFYCRLRGICESVLHERRQSWSSEKTPVFDLDDLINEVAKNFVANRTNSVKATTLAFCHYPNPCPGLFNYLRWIAKHSVPSRRPVPALETRYDLAQRTLDAACTVLAETRADLRAGGRIPAWLAESVAAFQPPPNARALLEMLVSDSPSSSPPSDSEPAVVQAVVAAAVVEARRRRMEHHD